MEDPVCGELLPLLIVSFCYLRCRYDPLTDQWSMIGQLSKPKDAIGLCLLGDKLYCVGGYDGTQHLKDVESYDSEDDKWTKVDEICFLTSLAVNLSR